ncbi:hypothetical protein PHLCEN_2v9152 [Hermanssonia centrifuga]|uniref:Uncharacterized protein n=1 Tax=Hermanssonia centrifuga TaxID=98765 RepID=A0A2R6NSD7_9APHY|nr:hypothetical protein PHLCEN_2v9152 [Hermanssonia centrifuga]
MRAINHGREVYKVRGVELWELVDRRWRGIILSIPQGIHHRKSSWLVKKDAGGLSTKTGNEGRHVLIQRVGEDDPRSHLKDI